MAVATGTNLGTNVSAEAESIVFGDALSTAGINFGDVDLKTTQGIKQLKRNNKFTTPWHEP